MGNSALVPVPGASEQKAALARKLGIGPGMSVTLLHGPDDATALLEDLPDVTIHRGLRSGRKTDMLIGFVAERAHLERNIDRLIGALGPQGVLWIAWPKRSSGVPSDMSDEVIREVVLPTGWVDVKVCAVDATWSGLKFVLRKALRPSTQ